MKIGDKVKCPHNQIGVIVDINNKTMDWFPYRVKILKNTLNNRGDIEHYKTEQLEVLENMSETMMIVQLIEMNDPDILNELAEIIIEHREKKIKCPEIKTIQVTARDIKTMNKAIREKVKK